MLSDFEKEKVFWTRKMNLKLVKYIEGKPHIWNPKHSKYTSVELRDHTYAQFAAKYGNQFTGQAVKSRWTNIRTTFASYLRKLKARCANGEDYKVNWHLWDACQFLLNVKKFSTYQRSGDEDFETKDNISQSGSDEQNSFSDRILESDDDTTNASITCKSIAHDLVKAFRGFQNDSFGVDNSRNGKVGRTVAKRLGQLDSYNAGRLSVKIMEILCKYNNTNPSNPNNFKSEVSESGYPI